MSQQTQPIAERLYVIAHHRRPRPTLVHDPILIVDVCSLEASWRGYRARIATRDTHEYFEGIVEGIFTYTEYSCIVLISRPAPNRDILLSFSYVSHVHIWENTVFVFFAAEPEEDYELLLV
jgi:hypothetical protein